MVEFRALFIVFGAKKTSKRPATLEPIICIICFPQISVIKGFPSLSDTVQLLLN